MTIDITIGKLENGDVLVIDDGSLDDGTNPESNGFKGISFRSGSNKDMYRWIKLLAFKLEYEKTYKLDLIIRRVDELDENNFELEIDKDRIKLLKFWMKKAYELYGYDSALKLS